MQIHGLNTRVLMSNLVWFPWCPSVSPLLDALLFLPKHTPTSPSKVGHPAPRFLLEVMAGSTSLPPEHPCRFTQVIAASPVAAFYGTETIAKLSSKNLTSTICSPAANIPPPPTSRPRTHYMATTQLSQPPSNCRLCFLLTSPCAWPFLIQLPSCLFPQFLRQHLRSPWCPSPSKHQNWKRVDPQNRTSVSGNMMWTS